MKNWKLILITLSLLVVGSTLFVGVLTDDFSSNDLLSQSTLEQLVQPLRGEKNFVQKDSNVEIPTILPTMSIQADMTVTFANYTKSERGVNDTLGFDIVFTANETEYYYASVQVFTNTSTNRVQIDTTRDWGDTITNGMFSPIVFELNGYNFREAGFDGPYAVYLRFYYANDKYLYGNSSHYEYIGSTKPFKATDFAANPITVQSITSTGIDEDLNGLFEWFDVNINLDVDITDNYYFEANIRFNNFTAGFSISSSRYIDLGVGDSQVVTIRFQTWDFREMGIFNTKMNLTSLFIRHDTSPSWTLYSYNPLYSSVATYSSYDFDLYPLIPTGRMWEEPYDKDGDLKYDSYRVVIEVNRTRSLMGISSYYLRPRLEVNSSGNSIEYDYAYSDELQAHNTGLINVTYEFSESSYSIFHAGMVDDYFLIDYFRIYLYSDFAGRSYYYYPSGISWVSTQMYSSTDFDGPGASLTGNYYDYGEDTDSDISFNLLVVKIEINVTIADTYYIDAGIYFTTGGDHIVSDSTTEYIPAGIHNVTLKFDGYEIHRRGWMNETIRIDSVDLYDDQPWMQLDSQGSYDLSQYNYTQFDPPHAQFNPVEQFSDQGKSTDGDSLWDELTVTVEVTINEPGYYEVYGYLRNPANGKSTPYSYSGDFHVLSSGPTSFVLNFQGSWFWAQHVSDASFTLQWVYIQEKDEFGNYIKEWDSLNGAYHTSFYNSTDFDPPQAFFTGNFVDTLVDTDGDTRANYLQIAAQINVTTTGISNYRMYGNLDYNSGTYGQNNYSYNLGKGDHWISLYFPAMFLQETSMNQSYDFYLELFDSNTGDYLDRLESQTALYNYTEFDRFGALFTGNIYDQGIDNDSDSLFDFVELKVMIQVVEAGTFYLYGYVSGSTTGNSYYFDTEWVTLSPGFHNISIIINKEWLWNNVNGSNLYSNYIYLYEQLYNGNSITSDYEDIDRSFTNIYYQSHFDPPNAFFTGNIFDYGVDTNANGKFDYVELQIEFNVTQSGSYRVYGRVDSTVDSEYWYLSRPSIDLTPGLYNFTYRIERSWLWSQTNGSEFYLAYIYLYESIEGEGDLELAYNNADRYFSQIYYHRDIDLRDAWVLGPPTDFVVDSDSDGEYDLWVVVFEVNVTVNGLSVSLYAELREQNTNSWIDSRSVSFEGLSIGIYNITLEFPGNRIYRSSFTQGANIYYFDLQDTVNAKSLHLSHTNYPLSAATSYNEFSSSPFDILGFSPPYAIFLVGDTIYFNVTISTAGTEGISYVELVINVEGNPDTWTVQLYRIDYGDPEVWGNEFTFDEGGRWDFQINVHGYEGSVETSSTFYYVLGGPTFFRFEAIPTAVMVGGSIVFEAEVWDMDGIQSLVLYVAGGEFAMSFIGNGSIGELWSVNATLNSTGEFSAYVIARDNEGTSSQSDSITIFVNEGPEFLSVAVSPDTTVEIGTQVDFTVTLAKSEATISSVTIDIEDEDGILRKVILEKIDSDSTTETWFGSFTPNKAGEHECTIRALTTQDQQSSYVVILKVTGQPEGLQIAPGFELLAVLGVLLVLPVARKKYKK